jgi:hypothetical protein
MSSVTCHMEPRVEAQSNVPRNSSLDRCRTLPWPNRVLRTFRFFLGSQSSVRNPEQQLPRSGLWPVCLFSTLPVTQKQASGNSRESPWPVPKPIWIGSKLVVFGAAIDYIHLFPEFMQSLPGLNCSGDDADRLADAIPHDFGGACQAAVLLHRLDHGSRRFNRPVLIFRR